MTILCIDDDAFVRSIVAVILQETGHSIHFAKNGKEGLDFLAAGEINIDLILLDIEMPVLNGYEFLLSFGKVVNGNTPKLLIHSSNLEDDILGKLHDLSVPSGYVSGIIPKITSMSDYSNRIFLS